MIQSVPQPKKRSVIRRHAGTLYYYCLKNIYWYLAGKAFATKRCETLLPYVHFSHATPLSRKLADVPIALDVQKAKNLRLACDAMDGLCVRPGETFSYWRILGRPTARKGYVPGMILHEGRMGVGVGGGLCQLSNLLYWMTLHTPLTITERWRHSYDVFPDATRTQPFGSGATCAYPNIDLQITNNTDAVFQVHVWVTDTTLAGEWRSYQPQDKRYAIEEREHAFVQQPWGGYVRHNRLFRIVRDMNGGLLQQEMVAENNAIMMYAPLISDKKG